MAKGQKQSAKSLTIAMILFVALWLTSSVLLVIMYTGQEELKTENNRLTEANLRLIAPQERNSVALFQSASPAGPTVVGLLEQARKDLAELATGEPEDDVEAIRGKLNQFLQTVRSDGLVSAKDTYQSISYHEALTRLYKTLSAGHATQLALEKRVAQLETEHEQLALSGTQQQEDFAVQLKEMSAKLMEVEKDRTDYREARDEQVADIERDSEDRRRQSDADLTEERERTSSLQTQVVQLRDRSKAMQEKLGDVLAGPAANSTARQPDGQILTAVAGDPVVYIDLGRNARIVLGQKFAVYDTDKGIPANGRAKAQVEVVTVFAESAECRILNVRFGEFISQGDLIANPIYDRSRTVDFVIAGTFDLDRDGVSDPNGASIIEAMVLDWGGTVTKEINARTDFIVLGASPRRPRATAKTNPEQAGRIQAIQDAYDHYNLAVSTANTLSVPILTQEVFLNFLGFRTRLDGQFGG